MGVRFCLSVQNQRSRVDPVEEIKDHLGNNRRLWICSLIVVWFNVEIELPSLHLSCMVSRGRKGELEEKEPFDVSYIRYKKSLPNHFHWFGSKKSHQGKEKAWIDQPLLSKTAREKRNKIKRYPRH